MKELFTILNARTVDSAATYAEFCIDLDQGHELDVVIFDAKSVWAESLNDHALHALINQCEAHDVSFNLRTDLEHLQQNVNIFNQYVCAGLINEVILIPGAQNWTDPTLKALKGLPELYSILRFEVDIEQHEPATIERLQNIQRLLIYSAQQGDPFTVCEDELRRKWQSFLLWAGRERNMMFEHNAFERLLPYRLARLCKTVEGRTRAFFVLRML